MNNTFGLHLPEKCYECKDCSAEFCTEFDDNEEEKCVSCSSKNIEVVGEY